MMPLSSHLRLEVLQESMEDFNLRHILFIHHKSINVNYSWCFQNTLWCGPVLLLGGTHPPKNHAASARPSYALLSFAFTFSGTLPINQSRTALFRPSRSQFTPIMDTPIDVCTAVRQVYLTWRFLKTTTDVSMVEVAGTAPASSEPLSLIVNN